MVQKLGEEAGEEAFQAAVGNAANVGLGTAIGLGQEGLSQFREGKFGLWRLVVAGSGGAVLNKSHDFGDFVHGVGARPVRHIQAKAGLSPLSFPFWKVPTVAAGRSVGSESDGFWSSLFGRSSEDSAFSSSSELPSLVKGTARVSNAEPRVVSKGGAPPYGPPAPKVPRANPFRSPVVQASPEALAKTTKTGNAQEGYTTTSPTGDRPSTVKDTSYVRLAMSAQTAPAKEVSQVPASLRGGFSRTRLTDYREMAKAMQEGGPLPPLLARVLGMPAVELEPQSVTSPTLFARNTSSGGNPHLDSNPVGGTTGAQSATNPPIQIYRSPSPNQFLALDRFPEHILRRIMRPGYALTREEAYEIAVNLARELEVVRQANVPELFRRDTTLLNPPTQRVLDVRNTYNQNRSGESMILNMMKAVEEDRGLNLLGYDAQKVGFDWQTGRYGQGGLGNYGENGIANVVGTAHRIGGGQEAFERLTTGQGPITAKFRELFDLADQSRITSRALGEANLVGIGLPTMHQGNVFTPALYLSTLHPYAWSRDFGLRDRPYVRALNEALVAGLDLHLDSGIKRAARELAKADEPAGYDKAKNKTVFAESLYTSPGFFDAVQNRAAKEGYVFEPNGVPNLRRILENMPFSTFTKRRDFVQTVDKHLQGTGLGFPTLDAFSEAQSDYPRNIYGDGSGKIVGLTVNDLNNPTGTTARVLGVPTTTKYELLSSGALGGRSPSGHYFDFRAQVPDSKYPGMIPFWPIASKFRLGARDAQGRLILSRPFEEWSPRQSSWPALVGKGPFFVDVQDKPGVLANLQQVLEVWREIYSGKP